MTDQPTPEEQQRLLAEIPGHTGLALRLVTAMVGGDAAAGNKAIAEIAADPDAMMITATLGSLAGKLAHELAARAGDTPEGWLYAVALDLLDQVQEMRGGDNNDGG